MDIIYILLSFCRVCVVYSDPKDLCLYDTNSMDVHAVHIGQYNDPHNVLRLALMYINLNPPMFQHL